jgi:hypothetical protein
VHSVQKVDALKAAKMGFGFGGARARKRPAAIASCFRPFTAMRLVSDISADVKLKEGGIQYMVFQAVDLPPWYAPNTPKEDTATGVVVSRK